MAWKDLSIAQRSQLMNIMRHNGITSISEMRRLYDLSSPQSPLVEGTSPVAPMYGGGGEKRKSYAQRYEDEQRERSKIETQFPVHTTLSNADRHSKSQFGAEYYDVVNMHYRNLMDNMKRRGFSYEDAQRLAPILTMQLIREGDWRTERPDNNFGGMRAHNRALVYDTKEEFYDNYLDNLDKKWGKSSGAYNWRFSKDYLDYARRVNRDDLRLISKETYDTYNRKHLDEPVYLYAPEWENGNNSYGHLMGQVRDRTNHYMRMVLQESPYTEEMYNSQDNTIQNTDSFNLSMEQFQNLLNGNKKGKGGPIHIKKENRGKFNALLERTGKSASWFKEHGTPLQKKRAIFALNARKWKHAHGGIKF